MLIGLAGLPRSGKDTIANILVEEFQYWQRLAFADRLRECLLALDPFVVYTTLDGVVQYERLSSAINSLGWDEAKEAIPEVRRLQRYMGTEVVRDLIDPNYWVDHVMALTVKTRNTVITDVRFWNEAQAVKQAGGYVVEVVRPGTEGSEHRSDNDLTDWTFDYVLHNNQGINELAWSVGVLYDELKSR